MNASKETPRGVRNNNPGNIRRTAIRWDGMAVMQTDPLYVQFISTVWGIRAMVKVLRNYRDKHGLRTVREFITRWAPPSDNNPTEHYIAAVAGALGVGPDEPFELEWHLPQLVQAIIRHENGVQPYPDSVIEHGIRIASNEPKRE